MKFKSQRVRILVGAIAIIVFFIGFRIAYKEQPDIFYNYNGVYVALIYIVLLPLTALINALRFKYTANAFKINYTFFRAFTITVYSTVANLLPLPGGILVRIANLKNKHNTYACAASATFYITALSGTTTFLFAALAYTYLFPSIFALSLIIILSIILCFIIIGMKKLFKRLLFALIFIEIGSTLIDAIRIFSCFLVVNYSIEWSQSFVLTSASVVGSAISIVPAGIGIKEGAASLIATYISLLPGVTYVALAINRLMGLSFFLLLTVPIGLLKTNTEIINE